MQTENGIKILIAIMLIIWQMTIILNLQRVRLKISLKFFAWVSTVLSVLESVCILSLIVIFMPSSESMLFKVILFIWAGTLGLLQLVLLCRYLRVDRLGY